MQGKLMQVFHGTNGDFEKLDPAKCITAKHLYTTPVKGYAYTYGFNVIEFTANLGKHLDVRPQNLSNPESYKALRQAHAEIGADYGYDEFDRFLDIVTGGDMYQDWCGPKLQDAVLGYLFAMGYNSISMAEIGPKRTVVDVVVFNDPDRLTRIYH